MTVKNITLEQLEELEEKLDNKISYNKKHDVNKFLQDEKLLHLDDEKSLHKLTIEIKHFIHLLRDNNITKGNYKAIDIEKLNSVYNKASKII